MYKIHCLNNISKYGTALLTDAYELSDEVEGAAGILVRSADMHEMAFDPALLGIARAGAGVNNIPLEECAKAGIVVFNTPGANANAVKELVLCGMLLAARDVVGGIEWVKDNAEDPGIAKSVEKAKKAFAGTEILGKKLGVIGLGAIGALVANNAASLGMDVYGYDPYVSVNAAWKLKPAIKHVTNVDDIYRTCDYITIHVPAMESTKGMIGVAACALIADAGKKPVVLNFSRDTLVDAEAMTVALEAGFVRKYVTDFATPAVMKMKNALVIPHLGASTEEAEDNCAMMATRQLMDYIENGNITNSVNYPAISLGAVPVAGGRVCVLHDNVPNMIGAITAAFGAAGANIANMANKAKGDFAYTVIDLDAAAPADAVATVEAVEGVRRVRVL